MEPLDDTIAAVASPPGGAARGILRLSGPDALAIVAAVFEPDEPTDLSTLRRPTAIAGTLRLEEPAASMPAELYAWPTRRSYTAQPVAELHTIGSPPLLEAALRTLCTVGARLAAPGEFTMRAFLAGRIDLTEAEAVLGVIHATGAAELDVALTQLAGGLAGPLHELRTQLLDLLAHLEAGLDFADEDLPFITPEQLDRQLGEAAAAMARLADQMTARGETSDQLRAVLVGRPNTGKSSLFNALAAGAGALVSHHPGTTRDYLTADLELDGLKCQLIDTAGVDTASPRQPNSEDRAIEEAAQDAAGQQHRQAHVRILCLDATRPPDDWESRQLNHDDARQVVVLTKADLVADAGTRQTVFQEGLPTSSLSGQGLDALRRALREAVLGVSASSSSVVSGTAARCRESLRLAAQSLARAQSTATAALGEELVAAEVRTALLELGKVVGTVYTDDVLERIFSRFCVGK